MDSNVTRRNFMKRSALMGAGVAPGGPLTAYAAHSEWRAPRRARLRRGNSTPEIDSAIELLSLPPGFEYRSMNGGRPDDQR